MGRIAKFFGRAAPLLGGYMDYQDSKTAGDDDIRAIANATGSTAGGWAGGEAGMLGGAAIGAFGGPVGVAVGGLVGGIGGAMAGAGVGRWLTGSTDELIRGKQMQHYDRNGNFIGDDGTPEPDDVHNLGNLAAGTALATTGFAAGKNLFQDGVNPINNYQVARGLGSTNSQAAKAVAGTFVQDAGKAFTKLPGLAKLAGGAALAYGADQLLGRPVERAIDSLTGQRTNLDNDPVNRQKQQQLQQIQQDQSNGYDDQLNAAKLKQMNDNPGQQFIKQQTKEAYDQQKADYWQQYDRERKDSLENSRYNLSANLGVGLMNNWNQSAQNVNAAMQTIGRASFL